VDLAEFGGGSSDRSDSSPIGYAGGAAENARKRKCGTRTHGWKMREKGRVLLNQHKVNDKRVE